MIAALRGMWRRVFGVSAATVTVRELVGRVREYGAALSCERNAQYPCDVCHKSRSIQFTVVVPILKGVSRPRFSLDAHRTLTVCWRCLVRKAIKVRTMRVRLPRGGR